ncbi:MAG: hypothetical protein IK078_01950 [Lachnospiraceae bacterium]|nr:hypothetical protein [Lachnospiraceae bacterium]
MKLTDDFNGNDKGPGLPLIYMMLGAVAFILIMVVVVAVVNDNGRPKRKPAAAQEEDAEAAADQVGEIELGSSDLTADDLDFWNMYKDDRAISDNSVITDKSYEERLKELEEEEQKKAEEEDLSEGGTKTKVIRPDGTEQWIMINAFINPNPYKEEGFVYKDPMMKYYSEGKSVSKQGMVLSEDNGNVDFSALKQAGIDFVMIRCGSRGYETGTIRGDKTFTDQLQGAADAGLQAGVYFESAAVTMEEAQEEALFVLRSLAGLEPSTGGALYTANGNENQDVTGAAGVTGGNGQDANTAGQNSQAAGTTENSGDGANGQNADIVDGVVVEQIGGNGQDNAQKTPEVNLNQTPDQNTALNPSLQLQPDGSIPAILLEKNNKVTYPIAIKIGQGGNRTARTDNMPKSVLSQAANAFTQVLGKAGYEPFVWGNKYWLLRRLDLTQLTRGTEVILEQAEPVPDYPYEFSLWQYKSDAQINGLKGEQQMIMSFSDYSAR